MKMRQKFQILHAASAVFCLALLWLRLCGSSIDWLLVIAPVAVVGAAGCVYDLLIVCLSFWYAGQIIIARNDRQAKKGHTIRKARL